MSHVDILRKLVEFPVYELEGMHRCAEFLSTELGRAGFQVRVDGLHNVYGTKEFGSGNGAFLIEDDMSGEPPTANWSKAPLQLSLEGDRLYGLNVSDKAAIATVLHVLQSLQECRFRRLEVVLSPPKRIDSILKPAERSPLECFLANNRFEARLGINLTGTVRGDRFTVAVGCGGWIRFTVTTIGKEAHTAEPSWRTLGHNAIYDMMKVIEALRRMPPGRMEFDGTDFWTELSVSMIQGGIAVNVVPSECKITCERRILPNENLEEVKKEIENTLRSVRDVELKTTFSNSDKPYLIDRSSPAATLAIGSVQHELAYTPKIAIEVGRTDSALLDRLSNVKTIMIGPGEFMLENKPDEYVSAKRVEEFTRIIRNILAKPN